MVSGRALLLVLIIPLVAAAATIHPAFAEHQRVLVVMSYHEDYTWTRDIREGIESRLAARCELEFFYMDTKHNLAAGAQKAREALALFNQFKPHGVIAADDNAQALFVVPHLRDMVDTPVIFCGVNAAPEAYGYPAKNVTGVLERQHFRETIAFAQMLRPSIRTVGIMMCPTPTTEALQDQIKKEEASYPAQILPTTLVLTFEKALQEAARLRSECDALVLNNLNGLLDENGKPMPEKDIFGPLTKRFGKMTIGILPDHVKYGALLTVANSGVEQGDLAAEMLLKCLQGTPVKALPITRNRKGQRMINLKMMRALGIQPAPATLVGATFYDGE